mgnify:CR=1 FL=1
MFDEYLKTFICTAECGSFAKTADVLYLSPNAVKKRINSLEEDLGFPLFERTIKGIKLTPSGKSFYNDSKKLVQNYNIAAEKAKSIYENKIPDYSGEGFAYLTNGALTFNVTVPVLLSPT